MDKATQLSNKKKTRQKWLKRLLYLVALFLLFIIIVPLPKFQTGYSTVLYSSDSVLLNARVAPDEQWRFEEQKHLPEKYVQALLLFEDRYFYYHPGINPIAIFRAFKQNIKTRKIVSGGSTITMQLARLSRNNPPRNFVGKFWEMLIALKAECFYKKETILRKYAAHAPFGGNVVGLHAACWRYFGIEPEQISWSQAATLAVLPNSPALIFPGRNQDLLLKKRNQLLLKLHESGYFSELDYSLYIQEAVPGKPKPMPQQAAAAALRITNEGASGKTLTTTLNATLQSQAERIVEHYHQIYQSNKIANAATLIIDIPTGAVIAYVGNTSDTSDDDGHKMDLITAQRSYGSTLKPILYMAAMDAGKIMPKSFLPDYPINLSGFNPKNYNMDYEGLVAADKTLIRSLNVPMVLLLQKYRSAAFLHTLKGLGMSSFTKTSRHYGLSLILGGGESSLWELTGAYASLGARLTNESTNTYKAYLLNKEEKIGNKTFYPETLNAASIWTGLEVMTELYRPGDNGHWQQYNSSQKIAWKTGTSFGNRDAWAIGINGRYAIGVWVGNASGEGRPGLTGTDYAAPIMFDLFSILPQQQWYQQPKNGWEKVEICLHSGMQAGKYCSQKEIQDVPEGCLKSGICSYHQLIYLDTKEQYRVNSSCENPENMVAKSWLVMQPAEALYYQKKHSDYIPLPPYREDCRFTTSDRNQPISLIYPGKHSRIFIPKEKEGELGKAIFSAAHQDPEAILYWHANQEFLGATTGEHKMEVQLPKGLHHFTLIDHNGRQLSFDVEFL